MKARQILAEEYRAREAAWVARWLRYCNKVMEFMIESDEGERNGKQATKGEVLRG